MIGVAGPGSATASALTGATAADPVSLGRILAVFVLGCILALLAALVIARRGGMIAGGRQGSLSFRGLLQPIQQGGLGYLGRQGLGEGYVAHHLTLNEQHWLVVTGPGGVCASPAPSPAASSQQGMDNGRPAADPGGEAA